MKTGIGFFSLNNAYDKVRPNYDLASLSKVLKTEFESNKSYVATEVAAGSGKFTSVLINSLDFQVLSIIEPDEDAIKVHKRKFYDSNIAMKYIKSYSDSTHIEPLSQDCIFVSQAFHFFPIRQTRDEFLRILKPEGKVFIFARFLSPDDEASDKFVSLTRFGKRMNGYKNNIQAYDENNIAAFFGKRVIKKVINDEYLLYTKGELIDNIKIRISASGDQSLIDNKKMQTCIIDSVIDFYDEYKDDSGKVKLKYQAFYFCSDIKRDII